MEDNNELRELLAGHFASKSFAVDSVDSGADAMKAIVRTPYDIVLLDYILPDKSGLQCCIEIRALGSVVPIIIVSVKNSTVDKVTLLNAGADDYIEKPFSFEEVSARVTAVLRRPKTLLEEVITCGPLTIHTTNQTVHADGKEIYLTNKEYALFEFLLRNRGRVVSRAMMLEHVWDSSSDPMSNTIEAHIFSIRRKLRAILPTIITTIPGRGYLIDC